MMNPPNSRLSARVGDPTSAVPDEQLRRAAIYSLLAALLRDAPGEPVLAYAAELEHGDERAGSELALAFATLALAARHTPPDALRDEYHALFIGLGRGELVPYGSWYQTGFLMERPLGALRADLERLGFERADDVHEPEDHIAALCEVMALLIHDGVATGQQKPFFDAHLASWAGEFFRDLAAAQTAVFYRSVARLGAAFIRLEQRYLSVRD